LEKFNDLIFLRLAELLRKIDILTRF
jgi:hypothetical protein